MNTCLRGGNPPLPLKRAYAENSDSPNTTPIHPSRNKRHDRLRHPHKTTLDSQRTRPTAAEESTDELSHRFNKRMEKRGKHARRSYSKSQKTRGRLGGCRYLHPYR